MSDFKFSCPNCGQHISANEAWSGRQIQCPSCQREITVPQMAPAPGAAQPAPAAPPPAVRLSGLGHPAVASPATAASQSGLGQSAAAGPAPAAGGKASGLAIASLVCGILTFLGCSLLAAVPAVICGHMTMSRLKSGRATGGRGLAIAGLVLGYLGIVATIVAIIFWSIFVARVMKQVQAGMPPGAPPWNQPGGPRPNFPGRPSRNGAMVPPAAVDPAVANEPRVATDPAAVSIPDAAASGTLHGGEFTCEKATLQNGILELTQGKDSRDERHITLFLFPKNGERMAGKTYSVAASSTGMNPHVHLRWPDGASSQTDNYCLRLEFGELKNGKLPGKLYLELSEPRQTKIAGTFTAATK